MRLSIWIHISITCCCCDHHSHFIKEGREIQRSQATCSRAHSLGSDKKGAPKPLGCLGENRSSHLSLSCPSLRSWCYLVKGWACGWKLGSHLLPPAGRMRKGWHLSLFHQAPSRFMGACFFSLFLPLHTANALPKKSLAQFGQQKYKFKCINTDILGLSNSTATDSVQF